MPDSWDALRIVLLAIVPGLIASRVWRNCTNTRPHDHEQDRIGGILIWAVLNGTVLLLLWRILGPSLLVALGPEAQNANVPVLAGALVLLPWALGRSAAAVYHRYEKRLRQLGLIGAAGKRPWDRIAGDSGRAVLVEFCDKNRICQGTVLWSDINGDEIYLIDIHVVIDGAWRAAPPAITGALLVNKGEKLLWISEIYPESGTPFQYDKPVQPHKPSAVAHSDVPQDPSEPARDGDNPDDRIAVVG